MDGAGGKAFQEDPFEVVAPVVSEHAKPDERSLDAVLEFEHSLEEEEGEDTSNTSLSDEPSAGLSLMDPSEEDASSAQCTGGGSEGSCTTDERELAERHSEVEPPPLNTADLLLNHNTGDVPHSGTQISADPRLQGTGSILLSSHLIFSYYHVPLSLLA